MPICKIKLSEITSTVQKFKRFEVSFWIVRDGPKKVIALRDQCAHQGAQLRAADWGFRCPAHNWRYNFQGKNEKGNLPCLDRLKAEIIGNEIVIEVPSDPELLPWNGESLNGSEAMKLLAHSCFLITVDDKKVLFDPWLFGDAYWGSWSLYPKYDVTESDLESVTDVVITHPHPDHFHLPTLRRLDRNIRLHYPPFLSKIIPTELKKLGFNNLHEGWWEKEIDLGAGIKFAFLRPTSFWEDSAVLVRVKDWVWLNQNDAGTPLSKGRLPRINLLSTAFDTAASGYPLTWEMEDKNKQAIMKGKKSSKLALIIERCKELEVPYFAPFASWWRHSHPNQEEFERSIFHVSMEDLRLAFLNVQSELLETYPSAEINLKSMAVEFDKKILDFGMPGPNVGQSLNNTEDPISLWDQLRRKLIQVSRMSTAVDSEAVCFIVRIESVIEPIEVYFGSSSKPDVTIEVEIPHFIAELLVSEDASVTWDSVAIGCWGRWRRDPDVYPGSFMRLLQLGYVPGLEANKCLQDRLSDSVLDLPIAYILEKDFHTAARILNRYGLPCASCDRASGETLKEALAIHDVSTARIGALVKELGVLFGSK